MQEGAIKSAHVFSQAIKTWRARHLRASAIVPSGDLKRARFKSQTVVVLDSGDKPGSFLVCACVPKYLRTILFFTDDVVLLKSQVAYITRAKDLRPFVEHIGTLDYDTGNYQGYKCLYSSDLKSYLAVSAYLDVNGDEQVTLLKAYNLANDEYHRSESGASFLTDDEYDELERYLLDKKYIDRRKLGSAVPLKEGQRLVPLPNVMPSLEYEKTTDKIKAWAVAKRIKSFIRTPKVDGISLQLIYKRGILTAAYTRGNGEQAELKTTVAKACPNIPQKLTKPVDLECRVEAYMEDQTFLKKYSAESGGRYKFSSPRATVAGMFNRKVPEREILKDVKILAFEAYKGVDAKTKTQMLNRLKLLGLPVVPAFYISTADLHELNIKFAVNKKNLPFGQDGVVIEPDDLSERDRIGTETNSLNPAWAKAFKPNSDSAHQTTVKSIRWTLSDTGYIKPTALVESVNVGGANVTKVNLFNAANVKQRGIGPGAVITVQRSGDAIPHMVEVIKSVKPDFSGAGQFGPYAWNSTEVDFILDKNHEGDEIKILQLLRFFEAVDMEYFSEQTVRKFYRNGFKTVPAVLGVSDEQLKDLGGFKERAIQRTRQEFAKLRNPGISLPVYMYASGRFGRGLGVDKLNRIYEEFGDDCLNWNGSTLRDVATSIETIRGMSFETGVQFAKGIQGFLEFKQATSKYITVKKPKAATGNKLAGTVALFTGFRNQELADFIVDQGGRVSNSFSSSVNLLLVKNASTNNDKTTKAAKQGTTVMTEEQFKTKWAL